MKKLFLLIIGISIANLAFADPWDNLTEEQATAVVAHLEAHPFILDYCDCCDTDEVYLLKVTKAEIVTCDWDDAYKSVKVQATRIGKLEVNDGTPSAYRTESMDEVVEYIIYMNYTFTYTECGNWAVPFFKVVDYPNNHVCNGATRFPNPDDNDGLTDEEYKEWFESTGMK